MVAPPSEDAGVEAVKEAEEAVRVAEEEVKEAEAAADKVNWGQGFDCGHRLESPLTHTRTHNKHRRRRRRR